MRDKVKRFISILMTALMLVNLMPVGALADGITSGGYRQQVAESTGNYTVYVYARFDGDPLPGVTLNASQWYTIGYIANVNLPSPGGISRGQYWYYNNNNYCGSTINSTSASGIIGGLVQEYNTSIVIKSDEWISANFKACPGADTYKEGTSEPTWHLDIIVDINKNPPVHNLVFKVNNTNGKKIGTTQKVTGRWTTPLSSNKYYAGNPVPETITDGGRIYQLKTKREGNPNLDTKIYFNEPIKNVEFYYKDMGPVTRNYTVNYYLNGTEEKVKTSTTGTKELGKTVTPDDTTISGYTLVPGQETSLTIVDGDNVLNLYYYKNVELKANSKTVLYDGTEKEVSGFTGAPKGADFSAIEVGANGTDAKTYPANFPENTVGTVDETEKYIVTKTTNGQLVIEKRKVTLTSASDSKVYDGTALTKKEVTVSGDGFADGEGAEYNVTGTQTNVGKSNNTFTYTLNKGTKADNYTITPTEGELEVTAATNEVVVTITEHSGTAKYDGTEKTVTGYTVKSISNKLYTEKDFTFNGKAEVKGTDAGTYNMELKPSDFENKNSNFSNVKFVIEDGTLTISKRKVTLTSASDSKVYDGTALTKKEVTVSGDGFADGEGAEYNVTGTQTNVGKSNNTFTYTLNKGTKADNYTITPTEGELEVTAATNEVVVTITEHSGTAKYDGTEKTVTGYTVKSISNKLYTEKDFTFSGTAEVKGTDAGTYDMALKPEDFQNTNTNFAKVTFKIEDGQLVINKRPVTLTSADLTKVYDGTPLKNGDAPVTEMSGTEKAFPDGEGLDYTFTGGQTDVGKSANTFTYKAKEGTNPDNYAITTEFGTLEVTPVTDRVTVKIKGKTDSVMYDGKLHFVFGFDAEPSNKLYNPLKDMQFNGTDVDMIAEGTDAGTYTMGLEVSDFKNKSDNFTNVRFEVVEDGKLEIKKRSVKLTSASDEKVYDGKPLTNETVAVGGDGFADGEGATYDFTGSQTDVGESKNEFTFEVNENTNKDNYTFEVAIGTLKVNPVTDKVTVTVTEKSDTVTYDGMPHTVSGYASMTADNPLYDVEDSVDETPTANWAANGTDAGEYPVGIEAGDFKNTNANFSNVTFVVEDGSLTITPAQVTLQAPIQSKPYDGTPLEATQFGHSYLEGLDFADDFAAVILTGSQTLVGSSSSLITEVIPKEGKKLKNYKFTFLPGTLTITDGTGDDPVNPESVVTKTHFKTDMGYNLGDEVTFTVSVTNIYNEQKEVTLEEQPGVTFVDPQGAAIGTKATKTLEPGEKWTIQATYTITLDDILADGFTNKVKANFKGGKSWNAEDYVETRDPYIELDVTKTADVDKAALGQTITYTITVDYQSNVPGKKVEVKDPLTGLETSFTTEEALEGKTVTFTTTYTVTEQDVKNGIVKNTATVKSELDNEWMPADVETPTFAPITIKPKDVTATYNGAAITGKDVEITSGKLLEGHKLSAAVIGSGVNAGTYELTLDPEKIKIVDANNKDVSEMYARTILPGKLIINKRSVLITSQSATKTYDGSALTRPAVTITGDGFVSGELAKAEATGSITNVGSTPNTIRYTTTGAFNAANYSIALSVGTLTVTEKPKPEPRRTFNLTINYVYQNGKRAAASYNLGGLKNGETFDITSPVIAGYTASETVVSGTIYNRDIKVTVIYTANGVNLDDYGVPLGLGNITMNVGDCFE